MTTLSLTTSKKLYELIGEYKTEKQWAFCPKGKRFDSLWQVGYFEGRKDTTPAPTFSELIRILPRIGEKLNWPLADSARQAGQLRNKLANMTILYVSAPTEPEGLAQVEKYLNELI